MEGEECFICGENVCDQDLLESLNLESVRDLKTSFLNLFNSSKSSNSVTFEFDFENVPLCYKCLNRVLDAHNLFNQINLLQIKLKALQFDVISLMKKVEEQKVEVKGQGRGRPKKNKLSRFQEWRKEILSTQRVAQSSKSTPARTNTSRKSKGKANQSLKRFAANLSETDTEETFEENEDFDENIHVKTEVIQPQDMSETFGRKPISFIKNVGNKRIVVNLERISPEKCSPSPSPKKVKFSDKDMTESMPSPLPDFPEDSSDNEAENDTLPMIKERVESISTDQDLEPKSKNSKNKKKPRSKKKPQEKIVPEYDAEEDTLLGKLTCPDPRCNTVYFKTEFSRQAHIKRIHEGIKKPFECEHCGKTFLYPTYLRTHLLSHTGQDNFPCAFCSKILRSEKSKMIHEKTHTAPGRPFPCPQCDKSFANKQHLESHLISHQTDTIFTCEKCGKTFARERSLELHLRTHDNPDSVTCQQCQKVFSTEHSMRIHQELHTPRTKPRKCLKCTTFECFSRRDLKIHMKEFHAPVKEFKCEICEKLLTSKKNLEKHARIHSQEKPFTCNICQKRFKDDHGLRRHKVLHYKQTLMCDICGKSFSLPSYLRAHIKTHGEGTGAAEGVTKKKKRGRPNSKGKILIEENIENETNSGTLVDSNSNTRDGNDETVSMSAGSESVEEEVILGMDNQEEEDEEDEEKRDYEEDDEEKSSTECEEVTTHNFTIAEVKDPQGEVQFVEVVEIHEEVQLE